MLVLDRLTFAYPGQAHPYEFSMQAAAGEITAISGVSGSGKSTLLDLIAGFLVPTAGSLTLEGESLLSLPPERRPVSLLLQSDNLFEHLSAAKNVALGLQDSARAGQRIADALRAVGLPEMGDRRAATLSGGQKQRVALARTLLRDSRILLLDEPFSALDDETRQTTRDLVRDLTRRQNWATVLVSHHADDIDTLAGSRYRIIDSKLVKQDANGKTPTSGP